MFVRIARIASTVAVAAVLVFPGSAIAAGPALIAPPAPVVEWQLHLEHMQSMHGNLGTHLREHAAMHGSLAGQLGPNGAMVEMMAGGMMR